MHRLIPMAKVKRGLDILSAEKRRSTVTAIIDYFACERNEEIGVIAAEAILDFMLDMLGNDLYNRGVEDAFSFFKERFDNLEQDMDALVKR